MIGCRMLGPVEIRVDGAAGPLELLWRKNLALLAYLACSPRGRRSREHLATLLWPDSEEAKARHSLNVALATLRRLLGDSVLETDATHVTLRSGQLATDLDAFTSAEEARRWPDAAGLVTGEFLEGFAVPGASGFEDWLATERSAWRERSLRALTRAAASLRGRGDLDGALGFAQRAAALDPGSEVAAGELMQTLALAGDRAGALERWERLRARHIELLGTEPGIEISRLAERIRRERVWRHSGETVRDSSRRRAPLVGRSAELEELIAAWHTAARESRAALLLVQGDAGTGKTRCLEELAARLRLEGAGVAMIRAVEADRREPGSAFLALARGGVLEFPGVAGASPEALAALTARLEEWRERFPSAAPAPRDPLRALLEVLRRAAEEAPVFLVIDDAEWADDQSLELVALLLRDLARLPVVIALGLSDGPPRAAIDTLRARLSRDHAGVSVRLGPLPMEAITELARWALPGYDSAELDRLARRVALDSAGMPLLAVELLHAVANGLDLNRVQGPWPAPLRTLTQTLPGELPEAVVAAVRVGFRRRSPAAQKLLQAAAVLGERAPRERLGRATDLDGEPLDLALDELEWTRWLVADARGYSFVARLIRQIVQEDLVTPGQRARLRELAGGGSVA